MLGKEAGEDTVRAEAPDTLIIAIGANPVIPPIKGIGGPNVALVSAVDRGEVETGLRVVVCGAGLSGAECALSLAMEGKDVTLVDKLPKEQLYGGISFFTKTPLTRLLKENNVKVMPECTVQEFAADGVLVENSAGQTMKLECDTAVNAFGVAPDTELVSALNEIIPETYIIGDAFKAGLIGDAVVKAYWFSRDI